MGMGRAWRVGLGRCLEVGVIGEVKENDSLCMEDGKNDNGSIKQNKGVTGNEGERKLGS